MKSLASRSIAVCMALIGFAVVVEEASAQQEFLMPGFDPAVWTLGHQTENQNQRLMEFVPAGQKIDKWTELLTVQTFRKPAIPPEIDGLAAASHENLSKRCPDKMMWNVIQRQMPTKTELASILFEWSVKDCPPEADQHEVARIIYGRFSIFRIAYVAKTQALAPEKREKWIKELSETKIVAGR